MVSIIIVNFNAGHYLLDCVSSVLANDVPLEVFVSDNNSTDNSLALLQQTFPNEPRLIIQQNNSNLGFSRGNNAVLAKTRGEFILFLNPDCVLQKNTLQQMQEVIANHPQAGMAGCLIYNPDGSVQATSVRAIPTPWNTLVRVLHLNKLFPNAKMFRGIDLGSHIPTQTSVVEGISGAFMWVRRAALEQVGVLDEKYFLYCEDVDLMMRFQQKHCARSEYCACERY
jgi:GT2 family glycosyltransferase